MKDNDFIKHPEGGWYKEVYRSKSIVKKEDLTRSSLTHIYFKLKESEVSRFHKVSSDEVWNLYEGEGVYLYEYDESNQTLEKIELSSKSKNFCHIVKADIWQATVPINSEVLVGCSVAPGFEFEDFEMIDPESEMAIGLLKDHSKLERVVKKL